MGDNETKNKHSARRRRNFLAKKMKESTKFHQKTHMDKIKKEKKLKPWEYDEFDEDNS